MSIKVCHIITRLILGGAQENTLFTVEGLQKTPDYDVTLVTGPAIGPEGDLIRRARKNNVKLIIIPEMRRSINPLLELVTLLKLVRVLKRLQPDIVHTHSSKAGILGRLAAKLAHIKIIIHTIHGMSFHPYEKWYLNFIYKTLERMAARWTHTIVTVADAMQEQSIAANVTPKAGYVTIYSGMEVDTFLKDRNTSDLRKRYGIDPSDIVIGKVARIFDLKGHEYVIESARTVIQKYPNVKYLFVGDGTLTEKMKKLVRSYGLQDHFIFAGLVEPEHIPEMIQLMDILVHCSLREGLARVLPQTLISGKPVISFDLDGANEVVINGITGYLVKPESVEDLTDKTLLLLSQRNLWEKMGKEGRKRFTNQFRVERMVGDLDKLYRKLLVKSQQQ